VLDRAAAVPENYSFRNQLPPVLPPAARGRNENTAGETQSRPRRPVLHRSLNVSKGVIGLYPSHFLFAREVKKAEAHFKPRILPLSSINRKIIPMGRGGGSRRETYDNTAAVGVVFKQTRVSGSVSSETRLRRTIQREGRPSGMEESFCRPNCRGHVAPLGLVVRINDGMPAATARSKRKAEYREGNRLVSPLAPDRRLGIRCLLDDERRSEAASGNG